VFPFPGEAGIQVVYERCAAIDVGKDIIAVAVRLPGDGPDGRAAVKRMYKTFYGVLAEAARWLTGLGVTHGRSRPVDYRLRAVCGTARHRQSPR
jgi:hypothetical protein